MSASRSQCFGVDVADAKEQVQMVTAHMERIVVDGRGKDTCWRASLRVEDGTEHALIRLPVNAPSRSAYSSATREHLPTRTYSRARRENFTCRGIR